MPHQNGGIPARRPETRVVHWPETAIWEIPPVKSARSLAQRAGRTESGRDRRFTGLTSRGAYFTEPDLGVG